MEEILKKERKYFNILMVLAGLFWVLFIVGTFGFGLVYLAIFYLFFLFSHSALISWLKGNAIEINLLQFPDIHLMIEESCQKLQISRPECYIMNGNGVLNAFATRFLRRNYMVLLSDVVDAFESRPDVLRFYIGHELGHIKQEHIFKFFFVAPTVILPLIYPAYRRSCEYVCDQFGRLCSQSSEDASSGLLLLMSGLKRWKSVNMFAIEKQVEQSSGFWMSFHELTSTYPWLSKRVSTLQNSNVQNFKKHNSFAVLLGLFNPGFLPGSFFPIFFLYFGFIFIFAFQAMPGLKGLSGLSKLGGNKTVSMAQPISPNLIEPEPISLKKWVNPITLKEIDLPEDFITLDKSTPEDYTHGRFSYDRINYFSQVTAFLKKDHEKSPEDYLASLKKEKVYEVNGATVKKIKINGLDAIIFFTVKKDNETAYTSRVVIWMVQDNFWEFLSSFDSTNLESERKNELLLNALVQSSL